MFSYISILFIVLILNIYAVTSVPKMKSRVLSLLCVLLLLLCTLRYICLYVFFISKSTIYLYDLKYFLLLSLIAISVVSYIGLRTFNRGELYVVDYLIIFIMMVICSVIIVKAPYGVASSNIGYRVVFNNEWPYIISAFQFVFSALMIYFSLVNFIKLRVIKYKAVNMLYLIGYILVMVGVIMFAFNMDTLLTSIIPEGVVFIAIIISFRIKRLSIHQ